MHQSARIFIVLALAMGLLVPLGLAQKPPAPKPPPSGQPSTTPGQPATLTPLNAPPGQPTGDRVMFLRGRVATDDGTVVPRDVLVERVCNARVRQQVYATFGGDFSMELGSRADSYVDATAEGTPQYGQTGRAPEIGIPRRELANCELRASVSGFRSNVVNLVDLTPASSVDVGAIVVHRTEKIKGMTLNAAAYNVPKDARRAFEKGMEAEKHGKLADARQYLQKAVEIYPRYTSAWFQLGTVLQKETQYPAARTAYTQSTTIDSKFLPAYLSLSSMAFATHACTPVINLTNHLCFGYPYIIADVS